MKHYTYEELQKFVTGILKTENPSLKPNTKNIGLWLKKNGYIKVRKQVDKERKIYYYR
jgi:dissimilatory sulfite reductase (desulfoviridin) alpha/beta subunit